MTIRVFEAFAGYGSQSLALKRLGLDYSNVGISEIEPKALKAYAALHGEVPNFGDITKITEVPEHDLFTYSFPCQDISLAGNKQGFSRDSGTRSSTLWSCESIIAQYKPSVLLLENVKALVSKRYKADFDKWLKILEGLGYSNHYKVLNAKDFGIPQNRERVFVVSLLDKKEFEFPSGLPLDSCLGDYLDETPDESYFISEERKQKAVLNNTDYNIKTNKIVLSGYFERNSAPGKHQSSRIFNLHGISPTLNTHAGSTTVVIWDSKINTLRKLTGSEYFRLMGLNEQEIQAVVSTSKYKTHHYFLAGNSIVVPVLENIFKQIYQ